MSAADGALPRAGSASVATLALGRVDRLGAAIAAIVAIALFAEPFATLRPNRIVSGKGLGLLGGAAGVGPPRSARRWSSRARASRPLARPAELQTRRRAPRRSPACLVLIGLAPGHVVAPGNALARVAPASGFWMLMFAFSILVTDAIAKLDLGPAARLAALAAAAPSSRRSSARASGMASRS